MLSNYVLEKTITYDVGGKLYRVSTSLVDRFPNTILSQARFDKVVEHSNLPIYIERNGERFQYVLDYMREGTVQLPSSVNKEAVLNDLKYLGFDSCPDSIQAPEVQSEFPTSFFIQMENRQVMQAEILQKLINEISSFKNNCSFDYADITNRLYVTFRQHLREDRMALLVYQCKVRKENRLDHYMIDHSSFTPESCKSLGLHILFNSSHNENVDYQRAFDAMMKKCGLEVRRIDTGYCSRTTIYF